MTKRNVKKVMMIVFGIKMVQNVNIFQHILQQQSQHLNQLVDQQNQQRLNQVLDGLIHKMIMMIVMIQMMIMVMSKLIYTLTEMTDIMNHMTNRMNIKVFQSCIIKYNIYLYYYLQTSFSFFCTLNP